MQTTDQVAGEAREKLADELMDFHAQFSPNYHGLSISIQCDGGNSDEIEANLLAVLREAATALRAQPERGAEEMIERAAKLCDEEAWGQLHLQQAHRNSGLHRSSDVAEGGREAAATLAAAIRALPLHPAKDDGGATDA